MEAADFWNRIKEKLSEKGKTQEWLCNETGMDLQSMRNRIYKSRFPSIEEALRILSVFDTTAEELISFKPDGIMISNGPGDPKDCTGVIEEIKKLIKTDIPIFAICLGHQLPALAAGFDTLKMK